jgi:nitroreductase
MRFGSECITSERMFAMDIQEAIFTRRSIRKFTGEAVDDMTLELVIRAGCQAPSAHNKQPWHFVIVKDKELLQSISEGHPYAKMLHRQAAP